MLRIEGLSTSPIRRCPRLSGVSLKVETGQFVAIVGPNGAGKTTLFKTICGIVKPSRRAPSPSRATICCAVPARRRAHLGIAHVPEGRQVFRVAHGAWKISRWARIPKPAGATGTATSSASSNVFPMLAERRGQLAGTLSGGEQQMLAIGRGLASSPKLLMLDEPSMGLAPTIADLIFERYRRSTAQNQIDHPSGRAARRRSAGIRRPRLCAGDRPRRARGRQADAARRRPGPAGLSRDVEGINSGKRFGRMTMKTRLIEGFGDAALRCSRAPRRSACRAWRARKRRPR